MTERATTAELDTATDAPAVAAASADGADGADDSTGGAGFVEEDLLVEEVSIDGMCGVY